MPDAVVIYDVITWADEPLAPGQSPLIHTALRGEEVSLSEADHARLSDRKIHPPYGAVAPKGSKEAQLLSRPISGSEDPAAIRARLASIDGTDGPVVAVMVDPAGDDNTEVKTADESQASAPGAAAADASAIPPAALEALDKASLQKMANALKLDDGGSKADLIARLQGAAAGASAPPADDADSAPDET